MIIGCWKNFSYIGLVAMIEWDNLPLFSRNYKKISVCGIVTPVVFTSFGFQVIFYTLTNYYNRDAKDGIFI